MTVNFGVQMNDSGLWWSAQNRFARHPIAALWFRSERDAELAALIHLPDARSAWSVQPIPMDSTLAGEA